MGELAERGRAGRGTQGDLGLLRRQPAADPGPFAGGGSIPLEAQRLGLEAHASDLNPVAVLINKALIEIPPKWAGQPPVHPQAEIRTALARRRRAWPKTCAATASGSATRPKADRAPVPEGQAGRRHAGHGDRLDLGTDRRPARTLPAAARCRWSARSGSARRRARNATFTQSRGKARPVRDPRAASAYAARRDSQPEWRGMPALRRGRAADLHPRRGQGRPDGRPAHGDRRRGQASRVTTCPRTRNTNRPPTFPDPTIFQMRSSQTTPGSYRAQLRHAHTGPTCSRTANYST